QPSHDAEILMDLLHNLLETCITLTRRVKHLEQDKITQTLEITKLKQKVKKLERRNKLKVPKLRRLKRVGTAQRVDTSEDIVMDDGDEVEPAELQKVVEVVTTAKLMKKVVTAASVTITAATTPITAAAITTASSATRKRKGVQVDEVADEGAASVDVDDVPTAADEPSIPSPTPTTQPPPPSQELPSTLQVQHTPPPSPIAQPPSPQQQPQP
nr:hypothetical protein [Tanacetum cinerariifolium]